ncbi:hypothetical protein MRB53_037801 [Persea americana]|nr:hypothetical protein MRB53_037801 [Persea americana]
MVVLDIDEEDNLARMKRGDLYYAFTPTLVATRQRCKNALEKFNAGGDMTKRADGNALESVRCLALHLSVLVLLHTAYHTHLLIPL